MPLPPKVVEILNRVRARTGRPALGPEFVGKPLCSLQNRKSRRKTPHGYVRLTPELIHAGKSGPGGWNKEQLLYIGILWEDLNRSGWIQRNSGRLVRQTDYQKFLALRRPPKKDRI